jgi:hypothetical protein
VEPAGRSDGDLQRRRQAANRFRPAHVRLLLVAHAPPASPDRYFYFEDVGERDDLFRYVVLGLFGEFPDRAEKTAWLRRLQDAGVFLIDLLQHPAADQRLSDHVEELMTRVRSISPDHVILIKVDVYDELFERLRTAGVHVVDRRLPFPGSGQQKRFEDGFAAALREIGWLASQAPPSAS